jgi:hypothetical protein
MKTVKSALSGAKSIIDRNPDVLVFQLKEVIHDACVELKKYDDVVHQVTTKQVAHLRNEPIYREINDQLSYVVKYQLKLM